MCMTDIVFTALHCVAVPVTDQERTKVLFEELGFTTTMDAELQPGFRLDRAGSTRRWHVDLARHDRNNLPTGIDTGIRLLTPDARAAHAVLTAMELEVGSSLIGTRCL